MVCPLCNRTLDSSDLIIREVTAKDTTDDKDVYAKLFTLPTSSRDDFTFVEMSRRFLRNVNHVEIEANFLVKQLLKMGSKHYVNNQTLFQSERAAKSEIEHLRKQQSIHQNMIQQQDAGIRSRDERIALLEHQLREKDALLVKFRKMCDRSAHSSNDSVGSDRAYGPVCTDARMGSSSGRILHHPMHSSKLILRSNNEGILPANRGILPSSVSAACVSGYSVQASFGQRGYGEHPSDASHHISKKRLLYRRSSPQGSYYSG